MSKRVVIQLYKFKKVPNIRGNGQEYKITNNLTGEIVYERTHDASGKIREKGNQLYYADTKTRLIDQSSEDEGVGEPSLGRTLWTFGSRKFV